MGLIDLDIHGHFGLKQVNFSKFELVRTITRQELELESPFLHGMGILGPFSALLKMGLIDLGLQGHFRIKGSIFAEFNLLLRRKYVLGTLLKMGSFDLDL